MTVAVTALVVVSILAVCVVLTSVVVEVALVLWVCFLVFGGDVAVGLVAGTVDLVLFAIFRASVVDRSSMVVGGGVSLVVRVVLGGVRSAGGSKLDCLGVREGGKK